MTSWPLSLPHALRAMVSLSVVCLKKPPSSGNLGRGPEWLIASGFVSEIEEKLKNWEAFPRAESFASLDMDTVDYALPLSLQDARLFLVVVGSLSPPSQKDILRKLLSSLRSIRVPLEALVRNKEFSSFFARVITTCTNLAILVAYPELNERLRSQVTEACLVEELPGFISESDWYRSERCFMGVFSDWESPRPPLAEGGKAVSLSSSVIADLSGLLEGAMALGFKAAKIDRGHLLFAAWNALGSKPLWQAQNGREESRAHIWDKLLDNLQSMDADTEGGIINILTYTREDICRTYVDMQVNSGGEQNLPLVSRLSQSTDRNAKTKTQIKKNLQDIVAKGEQALLTLLEVASATPELFACLEAISHYITFGIASHTSPSKVDLYAGSDSADMRRHRGDSLGSERDQSDLESMDSDSDDDPISRIRERLQAACSTFGAAPTHPDWLDKNCCLLFGIQSSDALDVARTAVRALTNLLSTCQARHFSCLQRGLSCLRVRQLSDPGDKFSNIIARKLCILACRYGMRLQHSNSIFSADDDGYQTCEQIASLFNLEHGLLENYVRGRECGYLDETKTAWCPNSAQRVLGRYQEWSKENECPWLSGPSDTTCSRPELRVDKQWEVLLATSLASSCHDCFQDGDMSDNNSLEQARVAFIEADCW